MSETDQYFQADIDIDSDDPDVDNGGSIFQSEIEEYVADDININESEILGLSGPLRKGKWTVEEEIYANKIIGYFNKGLLAIETGTTLRSYLSEKLNW